MSKVRNWRRRADDDEDDQEQPASAEVVLKESAAKRKEVKRVVKPSGVKLLSFVGDGEEGNGDGEGDGDSGAGRRREREEKRGQLKQGGGGGMGGVREKRKGGFGVGHRVELGKEKEKVKVASNVQAQVGEYTKEKLLELQRNTKTVGAGKPVADSMGVEPVVVLKGLLKPTEEVKAVAEMKIRGVFGESGVQEGVREREETAQVEYDAERRLGLMGIGTGADSGGVTHIPDAAMIAAAKARRNRLRQVQAEPDYIPVNDGDVRGGGRERGEGEGEKEDADSSEDEAEVRGRMLFLGDTIGGKHKGKGAVFEAMAKDVEVAHQEDDEADEERTWEEEQLRKGFGKRVEGVPRVVAGSGPTVGHGGYSHAVPAMNSGNFGYVYGRSAGEVMSISQQAEGAWKSLQDNFNKMRETHGRTKSELHRTEEMLTSSLTGVVSLEQTLASASEKYLYMQELRNYFAILCDFLQVKGPFIEELEEAMQRLHEERANAFLERRAADNADEMAEIEAAVNAAMAALAKGGGTATIMAAASAAAARDVRSSAVPQFDEFGRDVNLQKRMESKRRAQARERRAKLAAERRMKALKSSNGDSARSVTLEGESSSEESESEEKAYRTHKQEVLLTAERVFGDAAEEYAQLAKVKEKLESWKRQYSAAYSDAYMQLSAPSIFAPYVRLELLHWDPLYGSASFDSMNWYNLLFDYGVSGNTQSMDEDDADVNLIPKLVEKVALPVLHHELEHCWDVLSTNGTKRAVKAVQEMLIYVDAANSESLQEMLAAVHKRMSKAVATLEVPAWSYQVTAAVPGAMQFVNRQFGVAVRLLRNLGFWKDVLALPQLEKLALDQLLSGKMLVYLRAGVTTEQDAIARIERIVAALTGVWVGPSFTELSPKLASLIEYMLKITRSLEKKREIENQVNESMTVALARRMKRVLVDVNEYDRARSLNKFFQLKEAL
ncbi:hypothetical protein KC19_2G039900 [Ceratodon purpureus]|uniref:GCF C-terminal domain-containing protein n=1 Tax=Ceratodon purpureus TaxID=3225 RepID=A0A8T0IT18_CERPU|nr:hypothetical protein KC19_2G039900 [Ceratodon purpureus]